MKINYSFKLLIALFLLANLVIDGAAKDESGFSAEEEQLDLSFLDGLDLSFLDNKHKYCQVCDIFFEDDDNSFKEHLYSHEISIQAEDVDDDSEDESGDLKRRFQCDQCDKSFNNSSDLKKHERIHTGERPYQCDQCNKSFIQSVNLKTHKRVHTGVKPFQCDQCEKSFTRNANLKSHKRVHTGVKPFQCDQCEKSFTRNANLKYHKKVHTGERPYQCDQCKKSFINRSDLKRHRRIHTGEKPLRQASQAQEDDRE